VPLENADREIEKGESKRERLRKEKVREKD